MAEETEKRVVITFSARNLVKETADEVRINLRGVAFQFQAAAYSVNELNKAFFNNSQIGKDVAMALHGIGGALRFVNIISDMARAIEALTAAEWLHTIALKAKAVALSVVHALEGPWGWAILAGAIAAAGIGLALAARIPSRQFGGPVKETGPYLLHEGEYVLPRTTVATLTAMPMRETVIPKPSVTGWFGNVYVDARGSTFASHYDADKLANRILDVLKRAGVVER
jgi:hypothetical protein